MKKCTPIALLLALPILLSSCLKDKCTRTYTLYQPVYHTTAEVRANIKSNSPRALERPGKLFIKGKYIFLNEIDRGIHVIDNGNPSAPRKVAFIDIPGNLDVAVKGNTLYADLYNDMVTIDITDPLNVVAKKFTDDAFPFRRYANGFLADSNRFIVDWIRKDTTVMVDCESGTFQWLGGCANCNMFLADVSMSKDASPFGAGVGGSMARFALMNDYLYTVTDAQLNVFSISTATDPQLSNRVNIGWNIETIYPFKNNLFIGSNTGMFIYSTTNPSVPSKVGQFAHARTCDPVIADDKYAYVTLRSGSTCQGFSNQLDVLNIENINSPSLVKTYQLTNPHGLSKDGNTLFICDGADGVKIFNASNVNDIKQLKQIRSVDAFDVIAFNNIALVVAKDGLYQFDYSNLENIKLLSKISYEK